MSSRIAIRQLPCQKTLFRSSVGRKTRIWQIHAPCPQFVLGSLGLQASRTFSRTAFLPKKGGKAERKESRTEDAGEVEDPYDFSALETGIEKVLEKLNNDLSKLRAGSRFNPELLEAVRVQLSKDSKSSIPLGELAQVLPKGGRSAVVLVGETAHVKPVTAAIQKSELNLQPQQDAQNACQLNVPIPPPTKESRDRALTAASKAGEMAGTGIRNARAVMQKKLRAIKTKKAARPDDLEKAHKGMEKVVEKGNADVKKIVDAAKKAMGHS